MLKNRIFSLLSVFCSIVILMSCLTFSTVVADEPVGKMAAVYAYVLNNYLYTYSSMHTENAGDSLSISEDNIPNGVVRTADTLPPHVTFGNMTKKRKMRNVSLF